MSGIARDMFPVRLKLDGVGYDKARVIVTTGDRGVLWVQDRARNLVKLRDTQIASIVRDDQMKSRWNVTTESGEVWRLDPASGCGCGSPIKRLTRNQALA